MPTTHRHGHPALAGRLARIEGNGERNRAVALTICFCLPALAAVVVALSSLAAPTRATDVAPAGVADLELEAVLAS